MLSAKSLKKPITLILLTQKFTIMKITKKTHIGPGLWAIVCPKCDSYLATASTREWLPTYSICDCQTRNILVYGNAEKMRITSIIERLELMERIKCRIVLCVNGLEFESNNFTALKELVLKNEDYILDFYINTVFVVKKSEL